MLAAARLRVPFITGSGSCGYQRRMRSWMFIIVAALLALGLATPAEAQRRARDAVRSGQAQPLGQVLPAVMGRCPGQFLDAWLRQAGGGQVYVIKILRPGGRVAKLQVDARSGRIVGGRC